MAIERIRFLPSVGIVYGFGQNDEVFAELWPRHEWVPPDNEGKIKKLPPPPVYPVARLYGLLVVMWQGK